MNKIENFGTYEGRELLRQIYRELRYEKQRGSFSSLATTWKIATSEIELAKYCKQEVTIMHSLGFFKGTSLWLEEIVNRFFFSTINSFVYFGAAVLLVLIGVRRFSDNVSDDIVIYGIIFEAVLLIFMFLIMLFTPSDDLFEDNVSDNDIQHSDLLTEVGEISRDFAAATVQLEQITDRLATMINSQKESVVLLTDLISHSKDLAEPNPKMISTMAETNVLLGQFQEKINTMVEAMDKIQSEEIRSAVRQELESMMISKYQTK